MSEDELTYKNGTSASPAIALAINVLPVPGSPPSKTPFGGFAPISLPHCGSLISFVINLMSSRLSS